MMMPVSIDVISAEVVEMAPVSIDVHQCRSCDVALVSIDVHHCRTVAFLDSHITFFLQLRATFVS